MLADFLVNGLNQKSYDDRALPAKGRIIDAGVMWYVDNENYIYLYLAC